MWSEWHQLSILSLVELCSCLSFSSLSCFSFCRDCWPMNGTVLWPPLLSALQSGLCAAHVPLWMHWPAVCESREGGAGHRGRSGNRAMSPQFRIAVLGAQGVGKTAIVKRFLHNDFSEMAVSSKTRRVHLSAAVLNGHVHDLQITDYPAISSFPGSSLQVRYPTYHKIWLTWSCVWTKFSTFRESTFEVPKQGRRFDFDTGGNVKAAKKKLCSWTVMFLVYIDYNKGDTDKEAV